TADDGTTTEFGATARIDTPREADYFRHGGLLPYVLRQLRDRSRRAGAPVRCCGRPARPQRATPPPATHGEQDCVGAVCRQPVPVRAAAARRCGGGRLVSPHAEDPVDPLWTQLGLVLALVLLNAVFAGSEMALVSLRQGQIRQL